MHSLMLAVPCTSSLSTFMVVCVQSQLVAQQLLTPSGSLALGGVPVDATYWNASSWWASTLWALKHMLGRSKHSVNDRGA